MNLTRNILFEKSYSFGRYNHPDEVPESLWKYASYIINNYDYNIYNNYYTISESFKMYIDIVFAPLCKFNNYIVIEKNSHKMYILSFNIRADNHNIHVELSRVDSNIFSSDGMLHLKNLTNELWDVALLV